jgi:hypothetical protein
LYQVNATLQRDEIENAVHCAAAQMAATTATRKNHATTTPKMTIFVAADAPSSAQYAVAYGSRLGLPMITRPSLSNNRAPPLHLDRGQDFLNAASRDWRNHDASEYYDVFVDLYLLAAARCVNAGVGGYGMWAGHVGRHADCLVQRNVTVVCPKPVVAVLDKS